MGGMFASLFKKVLVNIYPCTIEEEFRVSGQKELRIIDNIGPLLTNHKLVVDYDVVVRDAEMVQKEPTLLPYSLFYQLTHLTNERQCLVHDDRLDALAIGCQYVKDMVMVDGDKVLEDLKRKEIEKFVYEKVYNKYSKSNPKFGYRF